MAQSKRTNLIAAAYEKAYTAEWRATGDLRKKHAERANRLAVLLRKSRMIGFKKRNGLIKSPTGPQSPELDTKGTER